MTSVGAICEYIAPFFALNRILFPANEEATLKTKQAIRFQGLFKATNQISGKWKTTSVVANFATFVFKTLIPPPPQKKKLMRISSWKVCRIITSKWPLWPCITLITTSDTNVIFINLCVSCVTFWTLRTSIFLSVLVLQCLLCHF